VLTGKQRPDIRALAAALLLAGMQPAFGSANCDVVICSYVTKTVICHRLVRACAYAPLPRSFHLQRRKPYGRDLFSPSRERF
jgi:hypothetical protein